MLLKNFLKKDIFYHVVPMLFLVCIHYCFTVVYPFVFEVFGYLCCLEVHFIFLYPVCCHSIRRESLLKSISFKLLGEITSKEKHMNFIALYFFFKKFWVFFALHLLMNLTTHMLMQFSFSNFSWSYLIFWLQNITFSNMWVMLEFITNNILFGQTLL